MKSAHARLLAIGLLTLADCEGRLRWVPMQVHAHVFPWEAEVKIQVLLDELIGCGYVAYYEHDGKQYVEVVNFTKHQRLSGKEAKYKSRLPAPPKEPDKPPKEREKASVLPSENGGTQGKQQGTSPGSGREPLGTGEQGNHRNRGTGEQGNHRNSIKPPKAKVKKPDSIDQQIWDDWIATRKTKRAGPITSTVLKLITGEAEKAGISLEEAITLAAGSGWITFKAEYMQSRGTPKTFGQLKQENFDNAFKEVFGHGSDANEADATIVEGHVCGLLD